MELNNHFVITETNQLTYKCTAMLINFFHNSQKISIGQSITSDIFQMTCPKIGKSRWALIVFPVGQYEYGNDNGQLSVYLKMIECEHKNGKLLADVKFFIDCEDKFSKVVSATKFHYMNGSTRWVGTNLISKLEFETPESCGHLMRDNNLVIGCRMMNFSFINDENIESDKKQTLSLKDEYGNSLEIDVLPYSSPSSIYSHGNAKKSSVKDDSSTLPSTSKFREVK